MCSPVKSILLSEIDSQRVIAGLMDYPGPFTLFASYLNNLPVLLFFFFPKKDEPGGIKKLRKLSSF